MPISLFDARIGTSPSSNTETSIVKTGLRSKCICKHQCTMDLWLFAKLNLTGCHTHEKLIQGQFCSQKRTNAMTFFIDPMDRVQPLSRMTYVGLLLRFTL